MGTARRARQSDVHHLSTREWQPGRGPKVESAELSRARHRERVRRRWLIGSGLFMSLLAAAAQEPLPEVALFLLAAFTLAVVADAGVALATGGRSGRAGSSPTSPGWRGRWGSRWR